MKKILLVLFLAMMGSMIFSTYSCNDTKPKAVEQTDEMLEEEEDFAEEEDGDTLEMELDSLDQDSLDLEEMKEGDM